MTSRDEEISRVVAELEALMDDLDSTVDAIVSRSGSRGRRATPHQDQEETEKQA
jgi:hypothetical protein